MGSHRKRKGPSLCFLCFLICDSDGCTGLSPAPTPGPMRSTHKFSLAWPLSQLLFSSHLLIKPQPKLINFPPGSQSSSVLAKATSFS